MITLMKILYLQLILKNYLKWLKLGKINFKQKEIEVVSTLLRNLVYYKDNDELKKLHMEPLEKLLEGKELMLQDILTKRIGTF